MLTEEMVADCLANGCLHPDFITDSVSRPSPIIWQAPIPIYANDPPESRPESSTGSATGSSSPSAVDSSSPGPSTTPILVASLSGSSKVFRLWHSRISDCTIRISSTLEHDGNSQRLVCDGIERSSGRAANKTFFRCINPHAPDCGQVTASFGDMSRHQKTTDHSPSEDSDVSCPKCGKDFSRPDSLKRHISKVCTAGVNGRRRRVA
ncbi:hypothetical protein HYPSUDRAFT_89241 [Hypholoma sublateritium FD-334 SS-4]|uniref:C2H2-type domain-containing protein n=1 Tax=Hypholoma sublateritium (strain FD-334 SS-4) TaxID=945553 RepID=A0A0D2NLJ9_HYPSF|nr:hypothetical protein HYPSUDRAFT_89241 [Hypholoma sublateritium FD-334 SS-4]